MTIHHTAWTVIGGKQITEGVRAAVRACVDKSTNSEGRIVEVNPVADFFTKAFGECPRRPLPSREMLVDGAGAEVVVH